MTLVVCVFQKAPDLRSQTVSALPPTISSYLDASTLVPVATISSLRVL